MATEIDRRKFLNLAAAGTAGLALSRAARAQATPPPSARVIVGVMGMSRGLAVGTTFASQPGVEVRYVCDVDSTRAGKAAEEIGKIGGTAPKAIGDFRKILDDNEVDVLVCAAPNHWHAPATILACSAGKHVYCEKPCSHNPREAELMVEVSRKHKRAVQVGTQRRSSPNIRAAMELLKAGEIGRVYSSRATYVGLRGTIGKGKPAPVPETLDYDLWQGPAPRVPYTDNRIPYNWHWFWHWGNGELGNNGVHLLDLCRWGLGVDFPTYVTSAGGRYAFDDDQETADTQTTSFEFPDKKLITWLCHSCNQFGEDFVNFYGDKGTLTLTGDGDYSIYDANKKLVRTEKGTLGEAEHVVDFLAAIRNDTPTTLNCGIEDAYKSTIMCHLGNIAQRTRRSLSCDASNGHILDDNEASRFWTRTYERGWEPKV